MNEFPKMLYRVVGEVLENCIVDDAAGQAGAEKQGFTADYASVADGDGKAIVKPAKKGKGE